MPVMMTEGSDDENELKRKKDYEVRDNLQRMEKN